MLSVATSIEPREVGCALPQGHHQHKTLIESCTQPALVGRTHGGFLVVGGIAITAAVEECTALLLVALDEMHIEPSALRRRGKFGHHAKRTG